MLVPVGAFLADSVGWNAVDVAGDLARLGDCVAAEIFRVSAMEFRMNLLVARNSRFDAVVVLCDYWTSVAWF